MRIFLTECKRCTLEIKAYSAGYISEMLMTAIVFFGLMKGLGDHSKSYYLTFIYWYLASGIISNGSVSTSQEKQTGTLQQLLLKPVSFLKIITYRNIFWLVFALFQILFVMLIGILTIDLKLYFDIKILLIGFSLFIALQGIGYIITSMTIKTAKIGNFVSIISYMLLFTSGGVVPNSSLPKIIQWVNNFQPLALAIKATKNIIDYGKTPTDLIIRLIFVSVIYFILGLVIYRKIYKSGKKYGIDNNY